MNQNEFSWKTKDGIEIYAKEWAINNPKAVLCIVHGLGEHCNRYNHVAQFFNQHGYAALGYDRRGHGQSGGKRGGTPAYDAFLDEVASLLSEAEKRYPDLPKILWGHSMGGNIVLNYLLQRHPSVAAVVVTGPWMELVDKPSQLLISVGKIINKLFGGFTQPNGVDPKYVSRDEAVVEKYINDPLVHNKISSKTGIGTYEAGMELVQHKGKLPVPTLLMHGEHDKLVDVSGSRKFAANHTQNLSYKEWKGLYHEIHNEPEQAEVLRYALQWLEEYLS